MVGLATKVWEHARLAEATSGAVRKLTAAGVPVDVGALDLVEPRLGADEPAFDVFWEAARDRQVVEFDYQRPGGEPATRRLEPWGVVRYSGRWYAVGHDRDRGEERVFRLSRVQRQRPRGRPARPPTTCPPGVDIRDVARRLAPHADAEPATLLVRDAAPATLPARGRAARGRRTRPGRAAPAGTGIVLDARRQRPRGRDAGPRRRRRRRVAGPPSATEVVARLTALARRGRRR